MDMTVKKTGATAAWRGLANCRGCGIRETALFADLTEADFGLIHLPIDEFTVAPGAALYHVGDEPSALYTVRSGLVKLVQYLPTGGQRIVRLLRPGDTAGLEAALGEPYRHTAVAIHPVLTCRIPRAVIQRLSDETQHLHQQLMRRWHRAVERADAFLVELGTGSARARVARLILTLADGREECDFFGREDVGAVLGITTETASRVVAELKRQDLLTELRPNRFRCDVAALRALAEGP
ncbi:Crp/Fnr family transcriptional regulator [Azospirillum picis]|uniref:CRP-like cAMP-binding protein n=1 Tax=Azospirillum picis TaxID=488438 RepID=A0ABU0MJM5_9PROT|nr:Crp/Fnr family transcriptional regulator [Azospirillum picis]MBP2299868.1 CRP-like cAMP-binding protein [Azospirillum picis]MDQ0533664.1 CRP-like cAMP-binding protein [Azospirillum picis]